MGLDPRSPGSHPKLKAEAQWLSHLGVPRPPSIFFKDFIDLFMRHTHTQRERERERERRRDTGRGRSRLHATSLMWDLIPGLQDHTPGCRWR